MTHFFLVSLPASKADWKSPYFQDGVLSNIHQINVEQTRAESGQQRLLRSILIICRHTTLSFYHQSSMNMGATILQSVFITPPPSSTFSFSLSPVSKNALKKTWVKKGRINDLFCQLWKRRKVFHSFLKLL